jgi:hypothetical protein
MKEIIKAGIFCMIGMALCFVPILHKNNWIIQIDGHQVKLIGE